MAGIQVTNTQLNQLAGRIALALKNAYDDAVDFNNWLLAHPKVGQTDPLVTDYVMSGADADIIRGAIADLAYAKGVSFDSSANVKKLWGLGE